MPCNTNYGVDVACVLSCVQLFATPWTVACQVPRPVEFSRQEYWSRLSFPPTGNLPDPGIKHKSLASSAFLGRSFTTEPPGKHKVKEKKLPITRGLSSGGSNTQHGDCS